MKKIRVWFGDLIEAWANSESDERVKAGSPRTDSPVHLHPARPEARPERRDKKPGARGMYEKLQPHDLVVRHAWLFA